MHTPRFKAPQQIEVPFDNTQPSVWTTRITLTRPVRVFQAMANAGNATTTGSIFYVDVLTRTGQTCSLFGSTRLRPGAVTHAVSIYTENVTRDAGDTLVFHVQGAASGFLYLGVIPLACD